MKLKIRSFATRMCLYVITFTIVVFMAVMTILYTSGRTEITNNAVQHTHDLLQNMATQINGLLVNVEATMQNSVWMIEESLPNPDSMYRIAGAIAKDNNNIIGCGIAFEPNYYKEKGAYFLPSAYMEGDSLRFQNLGGKEYEYHTMDWYLIPKLLKKPYWSEPYYNAGNTIVTTYALPLYNRKGEMYAIFCAHISLAHFTDMVDEMKPYDSSFSFMLSSTGRFLTHPNREQIMNETIFSTAAAINSSPYEKLGKEMIAKKTGTMTFENNGKLLYAFYTSIPMTGGSICNMCSADVILSRLDKISHQIIYVFLIGIALLFVILYFIIKATVRPLEQFSRSARLIATGRFDVELPDVKSNDEMKDLYDSFVYMQKSLAEYVVELQITTAAKGHIESELKIAHEIQMGMIPKTFPPFPERDDIDLFAILKPAKEVGGDLYDFFLDDNKLYFAVGDVSGKGIPASLFMAITRSLFHTLSSHKLTPQEIVSSMNNSISDNNDTNMFVTLIVGILDLATGEIQFCNAGHNPPILINPDGTTDFIPIKTNLFVGIMGGYNYQDETITLQPDSKLFLYTDGVTEAENSDNKLFSEERLLAVLRENSSLNVHAMVDVVVETVTKHVKDAEQSDDLTMLIIHYKPPFKDEKRD